MRTLWVLWLCSGCFLVRREAVVRCPTDHHITIGVQADVLAFTGCKRASDVVVRTGAHIDLSPLRELQEITGDLRIGPTVGVDAIRLEQLRRVGGTIYVASNGALYGVFLPRLEQAGRIDIEGNISLTTISMPRLQTVSGALVIDDNDGLELVGLASLVETKQLVITNHRNLELLEVGKLQRAESIRIENDPNLPVELVEALGTRSSHR